jgi:CubicO group peptidase (beta-lactamase class C family)
MEGTELRTLLRRGAARHSVERAVLGIIRDGSALTAGVGDGVTDRSPFAVGSLCKSMVATGIALLVDASRVSLDDPVREHVPELAGAAWAEATVRDLLANRSRIPLRFGLEFAAAADTDDGALARHVAQIAGAEPVGASWSYSNLGWCVLGRVLENVTGRPWEQAMRDEVFAPLGLGDTGFADPGAGWPKALGPAGTTLVSTVADMLRFARAHLELPALAALRQPAEEIRIHGWLDAWCLGWARFDWEGGPVWGWDGVLGDQRAVLRLVPEQRGAVVLLVDGAAGRALYRSLLPGIMESSFGVRMPRLRLDPADGSAGDLSRYAGAYAWPDRRWEVTATAASLLIACEDRALQGFPIDERTFVVDPLDPDCPTVTFAGFDEQGRPAVMYEMLWAFPRAGA